MLEKVPSKAPLKSVCILVISVCTETMFIEIKKEDKAAFKKIKTRAYCKE
jgi:hypothetical protein